MKYANLRHRSEYFNTVGDQIQIIVADYIYQLMGIDRQDVVLINKNELSVYDGEPVILPVSMPLVDYRKKGLAALFSPKIHPVFLGLTMAKDTLHDVEVAYLKRYAPVGCRDERTYHTLTSYGIDAYIGGCYSVILPERAKEPDKQNKVFVIDPTEGLRKFIPEELQASAIFGTHNIYGYCEDPLQTAQMQLERYREEAALVITSLLHCSVPCMAMGIPVILAKDLVSYRFSWLESLLRIYTPDEYAGIDWNPARTHYAKHKQRMRKITIDRLRLHDDAALIREAHDFYCHREKKTYVVDAFMPLQRFMDENWIDKDFPYQYAVWGLTQMSEMTVEYISKNYQNARLCHVYDNACTGEFCGVTIERSRGIEAHPNETVFVTTVGAANVAEEYFHAIKKPENRYALLRIII